MRLPREAYPMLTAVETYLPPLSPAQQRGLVWWVYGAILADNACQGTALPLALDATALGDRLVVRSVSVLYRGCAIPVAWHVTAANRPGA